jgi:hypothetical protein
MNLLTANHPFEQQPRESAKAFAAFKAYLDMGAERSLEAVAQKFTKSSRLLKRWSVKYDWQARVKTHGAHLSEVERKAIERVAVEKAVEWQQTHEAIRRTAWREAEETIAMVREARAQWLAKGRTPGWEGMARMLELAFTLKKFAAGMPNEIKEVNTNIHATIDVDWEIAIRKAYGVVEAPPTNQIEPGKNVGAIVDAEVVPAVEAKL